MMMMLTIIIIIIIISSSSSSSSSSGSILIIAEGEQHPQGVRQVPVRLSMSCDTHTVDFRNFIVFFCGRDPGNLKFATVRTNKQHICF